MKTRYIAVLAVALAGPVAAQVNEKVLNARAEMNKSICDAIAVSAPVDHPGKVVDSLVASKEKCIQEREVKQHLQTTEQCQKAASKMARPEVSAKVWFKECMNNAGYDVVE